MTTDILWDSSFSVGHAVLDNQHKKLLRLCNELSACVESNSGDADSTFHGILHELTAYAREHFSTEEAILKKHGYPQLAEQESHHTGFIEKITEILEQASEGILNKAGALMFLSRWWTEHILVSDMQYRPFLEGAA